MERVEVLADLGNPAIANPEDTAVGVVVGQVRRRRDAAHAPFQNRPVILGGDVAEAEGLGAGLVQGDGAVRKSMIALRPRLIPDSGSVPWMDHVASSAKLPATAVRSPSVSASRYLRSTALVPVPAEIVIAYLRSTPSWAGQECAQ